MAKEAKPEPDYVNTFPDILAPYLPTPPDVVERMLELANTGGDDFVVDLGCGDGRVLITAASKYGARGLGVDVEPYWVAESEANAKKADVAHLTTFRFQDAATVDLGEATVITLYLVQWSTDRLKTRIQSQAKPGTRIVSHSFPMTDWVPTKSEAFIDSTGTQRKIYLWVMD